MAINRSYQPPVALVGEVARLAGQGAFEQERDKFLAQQAQFYSQQAQQDQQFGARMQAAQAQAAQQAQREAMQAAAANQRHAMGLAADQQKMLFNAGQRQLEQQQEMAFRRDLGVEQFQQRAALEEFGAEAAMERQQAEIAARQAATQQTQDFQYGMAQTADVNTRISDLIKDVRGRKLDPQSGQKTANQMMQDIQAIRNQQGKMRPGQFAQAMGTVLDKYGTMNWDEMTVPEPDISERFNAKKHNIEKDIIAVEDNEGNFRVYDHRQDQPNPAFLGYKNQEELSKAELELIKASTEKSLGGVERPTMTTIDAYDELKRRARIQQIDPEIEALRKGLEDGSYSTAGEAAAVVAMSAGQALGGSTAGMMTGGAAMLTPEIAKVQLYKLEQERKQIQEESRKLLDQGKSSDRTVVPPATGTGETTDGQQAETPKPTEPAAPKRVRTKQLPSGESVDMVSFGGNIPKDIGDKVGGKFDSFSGLSKDNPIVIKQNATPKDLDYFSGRWVQFLDEEGNVSTIQIDGDMYDLDEIAEELWPEKYNFGDEAWQAGMTR